ncbi:MAG TPA: AAA family ATPase [Gemmatimonadaceae bacterium]|nr:AAA family ATPase [Gemmatimonadaceae bacterium]
MKAFATFQLDPVNQCLWRKAGTGELERILLSASEFGVLDHLTAHVGRLVTHRELLDAVWPGTAIEPQVVKSKIFHLRRALDDDPKHPRFIETLPRRGYRFVATLEAPVQLDDAQRESAGRFVGRESVLAELWRSMRSADAGRVEVVFVTGEAGIGKTALVVELQRQVALSATALRVARGQCVEGFGSKEAFYPVLDAVGELCRRFDGSPVVGTLASHAPTWLVQFPALLTRRHRETLGQEILGATRERMLREICAALEAVTASMPLLLVLEDLHWADPSTLDFISALARGGTHTRLMLVATYRPSDVARSTQPLHSLKRDLVARHLAREIVLPPLTQADVTSYLAADAAAPDDSVAIAGLLHRHTEGNPLFMTAVLQHLVERGFVERDPGWRLRRPASEISLEVPDSLREMIAAQVERLDEAEQRVLEVAAIAGMSFAPAICAPLADMNADAFDECCDALARRAHILRLTDTQEMPDGTVMQRYAFAHALYREVLYARQSPARRAMLHRRRAERMEEIFAGSLDDVTSQLAIHFEKGGDWGRAVKYLRRAADVAATRSALEEAQDNLQHAFDLASRLPAAERGVAETEILDTLADLYLGTFDTHAADVLALLRERAMQHGLVEAAAKALVDRVYPVAWESSERALALVDEALVLSESAPDPLARARVRAQGFMRRIWTKGWDADDASECARAMAEIRRLGTPQVVAWHAIDCNLLDFFSSRYRAAARNTIEALTTLGGGSVQSIYLSYAYSAREFIVPW